MDQLPDDKRLRANVADLFLNNEVSGARAQTLFVDASMAGVQNCSSLASSGSHGRHPGNISRDMLAKLAKGSQWPKPYWVDIPVWDPKGQRETHARLAFLLPHEIVQVLVKRCLPTNTLMGKGGMCASSAAHLEAVQGEFGIDELLGLGLWGDSMPCNWDRSQSVHAFTLNIPGLDGAVGSASISLGCHIEAVCGHTQDL